MRRALLLATLLAGPTLAAAQNAGEVLLDHGTARLDPLTVNATECKGGVTAIARYTPRLLGNVTAIPTGATYTIYGSDTDPLSASNPNPNTCFTSNTTLGNNVTVQANTVLSNVVGLNGTIDLGALISAAGKNCSNESQTVWICVQGRDTGSVIFGIASAAITISTTLPPVPTITGIHPGDGALNIDWAEGALVGTTVDTINIEFAAQPVSTTGAPSGAVVTSGRFSASPARFSKLTNGQGYLVKARAFSRADNASDFSPEQIGTPQFVDDFWDMYKAAGGRDSGGCSSGLAGPLGLGILIATLALARRRR